MRRHDRQWGGRGTTRTQTLTPRRDVATSYSVKQTLSIAVSGTLPSMGYVVSRQNGHDQIEMSLRAMDSTVIDLAQQLWSYLRLNVPVEKADCIVGLGSYDLRVAERCAEL